MKNTECNIIYIAITVYALVLSEVAAEGLSVGCQGGGDVRSRVEGEGHRLLTLEAPV